MREDEVFKQRPNDDGNQLRLFPVRHVVSARIVKGMHWDFHTLTEDIQFSTLLRSQYSDRVCSGGFRRAAFDV